jgi:hypothetical protein
MELSDGYVVYPSIPPSTFISSTSLTWDNRGLIGVIADDQETALTTLGPPIIAANALAGRTVKIFDMIEGEIVYLQWRLREAKNGGNEFPPQNVLDDVSAEFIKRDAIANDYIALFFYKLSDETDSIDKNASEISMDYTYEEYTLHNIKHIQLKRELSKYYIYNQDIDIIYDFKTFS